MERRVKKAGKLLEDKLIAAKNNVTLNANPGFEKKTDVHWFCNDGRGKFNHRMVWPMNYNLEKVTDKPMRLQVSVRDYDGVGKDELIGQVQLDLQSLLKTAFKTKDRNDYLKLTTPFRIAEGLVTDWKLSFDLKKNGKKTGEVVLQIEVASKLVGMLRPCGEGRSQPNNHPFLPEPKREPGFGGGGGYNNDGACCGCFGGSTNLQVANAGDGPVQQESANPEPPSDSEKV
jgi:hypothetical protein